MSKPLVTYEQAEEVAAFFEQHQLVMEVQVFGSVSYNRRGNDLDIILVTDRETSLRWMRAAKHRNRREAEIEKKLAEFEDFMPNPPAGSNIGTRDYYPGHIEVAAELLGERFVDALDTISERYPEMNIDLFVLWPDWQSDADTLTRIYRQVERRFWHNIAEQARTISTKSLRQPSLL